MEIIFKKKPVYDEFIKHSLHFTINDRVRVPKFIRSNTFYGFQAFELNLHLPVIVNTSTLKIHVRMSSIFQNMQTKCIQLIWHFFL